MPEYGVMLGDPPKSLLVTLNKLRKRGSWFPLDDGTPAQAKEIRMIRGEPVIYAVAGTEQDKPRLKAHRDITKPS